jgi:putative ABC transport system permease protein
MEGRLLRAALARKRGTVGLAITAVAIGASVASALLHVSGDVSRKLSRELRTLGPNLLVAAATTPDARDAVASGRAPFLDERAARARLAAAGIDGVPVLYTVARAGGQTIPVIGTDLAAASRLHPAWSLPSGAHASLIGARLMRRLGVRPGETVMLQFAGGRRATLTVEGPLEAGGADDEAWWIPLADAQGLAGAAGQVSLMQARVDGGVEAGERAARAIEAGGGMRAIVLRALSRTEGDLLDRMRRLMTLVTVAALLAAGLCAFGTLTDLALERRRDIALMKSLGASRHDVVRQFLVEALAIGLLGGVAGWAFGLLMAEVIGQKVFHSSVGLRPEVPPLVIALSLAVAGFASLGPIRLALAVEPAAALKGD